MKIKTRTKKVLVLSVMVMLLVATGVLNWALNDKLTGSGNPVDAGKVTETFFSSYRSERETSRESEFLYLDAIMTAEATSAEGKLAAENLKLNLVERIDLEMKLETLIKAKGFEDVVVTMGTNTVNVIVGAEALSAAEAAQILAIIKDETTYTAKQTKITPYN